VALGYDPMLRLYQVAGAATTRFAYDGLDAIAEYNASNALQKRTVFGPAMDEPIVQYNAAGARAWFTADERGSIVAIVNDSGMTRINTYDEYGKPGSGNIGRYQYTGQMWLPEAGLYYYKARMYSAQLGRFVQPDPIGFADSPNLYNYVLGDPVNYVDPLGLAGCPPDTWVCGARLPTLSTHDLESAQKPSLAEPNNTGEGGGDIVVTGRRLRQKKVSQCMINFIASQGYNTSGLENVTFYKGSLTAQSVYNTMGNPAITIGNSIHVASAAWRGISSPSGGAAYFEEIIHTRQYQSWGMMGFGAAYGVASAMGKVRGYNMSGFIFGDAHDNPVEQQAIAMSVGLLKAYNALPVSKRCSD
jgi:RHS repeat-associated protein